jgi:hypothetical protein
MRYLHSKSRAEDAALLEIAFASPATQLGRGMVTVNRPQFRDRLHGDPGISGLT